MIYTKWRKITDDINDILCLRQKVYAIEYNLAIECKTDEGDIETDIVAVYDGDGLCASGAVKKTNEGVFALSRIAVLPEKRKSGYGDLVIRMLVRRAFDCGAKKVLTEARVGTEGFFEKVSFKRIGGHFVKDGMPHIKMICTTDVSGKCAENALNQ